jgi:hypothetical protein
MPKKAAIVREKARMPDVDVTKIVAKATKALEPAVEQLREALAALDMKKVPQGALADLLYDLEQMSASLASIAKPALEVLGPGIKAIEDHFVSTLAVGEATGVQGQKSRVQVTSKAIPQVAAEDWPKFYAHIKKTGEFELLNRAVNRKAVQDRWDAKKQVPGVKPFFAKVVSCTKLSARKAG